MSLAEAGRRRAAHSGAPESLQAFQPRALRNQPVCAPGRQRRPAPRPPSDERSLAEIGGAGSRCRQCLPFAPAASLRERPGGNADRLWPLEGDDHPLRLVGPEVVQANACRLPRQPVCVSARAATPTGPRPLTGDDYSPRSAGPEVVQADACPAVVQAMPACPPKRAKLRWRQWQARLVKPASASQASWSSTVAGMSSR